ncbi:Amidase [Penicillium griseofulvum]|uniref:Amidase n=1 Tax=Penicillium patulum TaxID=5078 RepID=A0A135LM88_PENPA|nr:Amidase [Penicillium griseofulvum]KXG50077.1 Amidase [Penicillium griseofulvum]
MIGREEPLEAVDFRTSFNSRGEEYQSLVGSSNGSAACVAGYDWIDCAIGTDTSSSGRRPAMRYHSDLRSLRDTRRICQEFRHTQGCCSDLDPKHIDPIREAWKQPHPLGTPENLDDYLIDTVLRAYYNAFYHSFVAFREKYAEKHSGKPPYALPSLQYRWETGAAVSEEQHKDAVQRMGIYRDWLLTRMLAGSTSEAEPLVVLPIGNLAPNYREESSPSPLGQSALDQLFLPPILVAPDIAIPIGEVPYESKITKGTEYLPVVIDITGAPTKDQELLQAIEKIMDVSGRPTTVTTGLRVFQCQV